MKDEASIEITKWNQMEQCLSIKSYQPNITYLWYVRCLIDNLFVFLLQLTGFSLNQHMLSEPPIMLTAGVGLAILMLKGKIVLPGCFFGAFLSYYIATGMMSTAFLFAFFQVIPLVFFMQYANTIVGATLIDLSLKKQFLLYIGMFITAFLISLFDFSSITFFSTLNGLLVMSLTILTVDLYFVDWCELKKQTWRLVMAPLTFYALLLFYFFYSDTSLFIEICSIPMTLCLLFGMYYYMSVLGVILILFLFAFIQLCSAFFMSFEANKIIWIQCLLFINIVFAMYLMRRRDT